MTPARPSIISRARSSAPGSPPEKPPFLSVGGGAFCFVEDARCKAALLASAHIAAGTNVLRSQIGNELGITLPYTQFGFRGGLTVRPLVLARKRDWHPWALGATVGWSRGSGQVSLPSSDSVESTVRTAHTDALRIALLNQIWLSSKRNAIHIDISIGAIQSNVLDKGAFWGTHLEVAGGVGGWGALFASTDFLDGDTRIVFGLRAHALPAAPIAGLVILGLLAGGALSSGGAM